MKALDHHKRHEIVIEYRRCHNISKVAEKLHVSRETVRLWVQRFRSTKGVDSAAKPGRKTSLNKKGAHQARKMLLSGNYSGSQEVARELHAKGLTTKHVPLHRTTVVRHAKAVSKSLGRPIVAVQGPPKKALTATNKEQRVAFCKANLGRSWKNVMFTDRKKFMFTYPGAKVHKSEWVEKGKPRLANKSSHALSVNLYAGITVFGMTKPHIVAGTSKMTTEFSNQKGKQAKNITSSEYEQVVLTTLLPEGRRLMGYHGITSWVLQQDNDPTHKKASARALGNWLKDNPGQHVTVLQKWPPNSPDLSPIENVWAYVQAKVNALGCESFGDFQVKVVSLLKNLPHRMRKNLFASMHSRLTECMDKRGERTHY
jgi:transposase